MYEWLGGKWTEKESSEQGEGERWTERGSERKRAGDKKREEIKVEKKEERGETRGLGIDGRTY